MRLISKCNEVVFHGRCVKCGSLVELNKEEFHKAVFDCPVCGMPSTLRKGTIRTFFINEEGDYERG